MSEDEIAGWHHHCNRQELGQNSGNGEGLGGLACCSPWGCKELDTTGGLSNNTYTEQETCRIYYSVSPNFKQVKCLAEHLENQV